jgi:choline dehydrogenase
LGRAVDLREAGVDVVADLPGVGRNLKDHASVSVDLSYREPLSGDPVFQLVGTLHSSGRNESSDPPDLQLMVGGPYPGDTDSRCFIAGVLLKPDSRGSVRLHPADPTKPPLIDLGYFTEPDDLARLGEGFERAQAAAAHPSLRQVAGDPEPIEPATVEEFIHANAWTYHHPVGTCAMGPDPDAGAVVDELGRVHGVAGLSVIDASVMPDIPSANTNIPTLAVAEHIMRLRKSASG